MAVVGVIVYHLDARWMPGGFLGVDLFMVLSGFLITRLMLLELAGTSTIALGAFWTRRAKRLLPASVLLVVGGTVLSALLLPSERLGSVRLDALASLFYVANWRFIWSGASYFDLFSSASPFRHLWSLAIEEQFYVVWPLLVVALRRRVRLIVVATVLAVASTVAMALRADDLELSRAYFGSDTRFHTLLVGCLVALILHDRVPAAPGRAWTSVRLVAAAVMIGSFALVHDTDRWMYRGGFLAVALVAAVLVASYVISPRGTMMRALESPPLALVGRMSYSLYLWHWPAVVFLDEARCGLRGVPLAVVRMAATAVAAGVSYRFVETPLRHTTPRPSRAGRWVATSAIAATAAVLLATIGATEPPAYFSADGSLTGLAPASETTAVPGSDVVDDATTPPSFLVLGDSVVASLSDALSAAAGGAGVRLGTAPVSGCGLLPGLTLDTLTQEPYPPSAGCFDQVSAAVEAAIATAHPSHVVWLSVWDAENRIIGDDPAIQLETAEGRDRLYALIDDRVTALEALGVEVVVVTVPVVGSSDSRPAPPDIKQRRITAYDETLLRYAADHPGTSVIDLAAHVCPGGAPCDDLGDGGIVLRPTDGIHYEGDGARQIAAWLVAQLGAVSSAGS
jgi:peptidoglycan/LPS O-acetylase OafA/YrhL